VFVRVRDGIEGLFASGDAVAPADADGKERTFKTGDEIEAEIANIDTQERQITLSMRVGETGAHASGGGGATAAKPAQRSTKAPKKSAASEAAGGTIGDLIKQKLGGKLAAIGTEKEETPAPSSTSKTESEGEEK